MDKTEQRRRFIIRFVYVAIWAGLLFLALKYALPLVMPFVVAFIFAFVLKPVINLFSKKARLPRKAVAIIVLSLFYIFIALVLGIVGTRLVIAIASWARNLPQYYTTTIEPALAAVGTWFTGISQSLNPVIADFLANLGNSISSGLSGLITTLSGQAVNMATNVGWFVVGAFLTVISSYFFVVDYYKVTSFITKQLTPGARRKLFVVKDYAVNVLFRFGSAYLILMSITFLEVLIGLSILGADSPVAMALITAVVDILPVFGTGTILIPWAAFALLTGNYFFAIGVVILYAVITIIRQVLEPRVVGRQIGLYPLLTLICMFIGVQLFGFWGLFALPITLTVIIHLNRAGEISLFKE